jgi:hypothetical protein
MRFALKGAFDAGISHSPSENENEDNDENFEVSSESLSLLDDRS